MTRSRGVRDNRLLDRLDAIPRTQLSLTIWRAVRDGRDPLQCGRPGGRWDDGTFDVLYTAADADGAVAEIWFHLAKGQPIFPTLIKYRLYQLKVDFNACASIPDLATLAGLGLDVTKYGRLSYAELEAEYPRSQELGEHLHFLGADGLVVPSARWACLNAVLFCEHLEPARIKELGDHGLVDWHAWTRQHGGSVQ